LSHRQLIAVCAGLAATGLVACQTTQKTSDIREAEAAELIKAQQFRLGGANRQVEVVSSAVISDEYGSAVVVELRNTGNQTQVGVPILVDVRDASGKSVYRNDISGLEPTLNHVQLIEPGETVAWVNDQVQATGKPESVDVKVGESTEEAPPRVPKFEISPPRLNVDSSGIEVEGSITNSAGIEQIDMTVYAVSRSGGRVIAAGRGQIKALKPEAKPGPYNIFFIGDPRGGEIEVTAPATVFE
jgi:hypothetical protein